MYESEQKQCSDCGEVKPREIFGIYRRSKDGRFPRCRVCRSLRDRVYRESLPDPFYDGTKVCEACHRELPRSCFHKHIGCKDGFRPSCRECHATRQREISHARFDNVVFRSKTCRLCLQEKDPEEFRKSSYSKDGLDTVCKACHTVPLETAPRFKVCLDCKQSLSSKEFSINRRIGDGPNTRCRDCDRERRRKRKLDDPIGSSQRNYESRLISQYGLTPDKFSKMVIEQGGGCAICGGDNSTMATRPLLYVDHDHITGKVRGLLCSKCNSALGFANESVDRLLAMASYLERWQMIPEVLRAG